MKLLVAAAVAAAALAACKGKDPETQRIPPVAGAAARGNDVPRYEATLETGIKFWLPGLPSMVAEMSGVAQQETWGRWTNGPVVVIRFREALPKEFTLVVTAAAYGANAGVPIQFVSGQAAQSAVFPNELGKGPPVTREMKFAQSEPSDRIEIRVPRPQEPGGGDTRALGLALVSLQVLGP